MTENDAMILASGQVSHALLAHLSPVIEYQSVKIIQRLKNLYRAGENDNAKLVAAIAELCALEDMELTLKSRVRRSERVANKEGVPE